MSRTRSVPETDVPVSDDSQPELPLAEEPPAPEPIPTVPDVIPRGGNKPGKLPPSERK